MRVYRHANSGGSRESQELSRVAEWYRVCRASARDAKAVLDTIKADMHAAEAIGDDDEGLWLQ